MEWHILGNQVLLYAQKSLKICCKKDLVLKCETLLLLNVWQPLLFSGKYKMLIKKSANKLINRVTLTPSLVLKEQKSTLTNLNLRMNRRLSMRNETKTIKWENKKKENRRHLIDKLHNLLIGSRLFLHQLSSIVKIQQAGEI